MFNSVYFIIHNDKPKIIKNINDSIESKIKKNLCSFAYLVN